jgi:hypothetical protein
VIPGVPIARMDCSSAFSSRSSSSSSTSAQSTLRRSPMSALETSRHALLPSSSFAHSRASRVNPNVTYDSTDSTLSVPTTYSSGEMPCDSTLMPDASPRSFYQGEGLDSPIVSTQVRFWSQKRLHPPQVLPKRTGGHSCYDPSLFIPTELLFRCTSYLDPQSLMQLQGASKFYNDLAKRNEAGWADICHQLWRDKAVVAFRDRSSGLLQYDPPDSWMQGYFSSMADAKRASLTLEDLVFDPPGHTDAAHHDAQVDVQNHDFQCPAALLCRLRRTNNVWSFRFKESAGNDWTGQDPWYSGEPCRKLAFMRDGTILHYVDFPPAETTTTSARTKTSQSHSDCPLNTSSSATNPLDHSTSSTPFQLKDPPLPMRWRFLSNRPIDLPSRPFGSYIRMSVGGRDVPTYSVFRCEANWGFVMESCWGLYANFELPPRLQTHPPAGGLQQGEVATPWISLPIRQRRRLRRTENGTALWVVVEEDGDGESEDRARRNERTVRFLDHPSVQRLQDDTNLFITNEVQWREAFLYNVGALVLPEGDEATSHFDRAWQGVD